MRKLAEHEMLQAIASGEPFCASLDDGAFELKIDEYCPYVGTAIHAGHRLREDLLTNCLLDDGARLLEEDPFTDRFVADFPITLVCRDSRYEYDLNRGPDSAVYDTAWGVEVWRDKLTDEQRAASLEKHARFYRVMRALAARIEQRCGGCMILDTHSYNYRIREHAAPPVFNIGTEQVDEERWRSVLDVFERELPRLPLPAIQSTLGWNAVFYGRGYQATVARQDLPRTLVVPLEVKKVFMDETTGEPFPDTIEAVRAGFSTLMAAASATFVRDHCGR
ncbi:MAG: hypothetical protein DRR04_01440 [Gammaproteobacteria bacterium]|nr:MAG: hypothetical protein DRQ97_02925 [Gammaproteobacteria bacterium]RLA62034.1 MAG: hypothetical protein DRR04_01440 [Gammaproteobacteria bacterium]HDY83594.1 hypothetical protein [Halieaceae bacterium]